MLRLTSVKIERFRGIREGEINGFADVNVLIGRNNSGKTTVVEAIMKTIAAHYSHFHDYAGRQSDFLWNEIRGDSQAFPREAWYRQDSTLPIELNVRIETSKQDSSQYQAALAIQVESSASPSVPSVPSVARDIPAGFEPKVRSFCSALGLFRSLDGVNARIEAILWPRLLANRMDKLLTKSLNEIFSYNAESIQILPGNRLMVLFDSYSLPLDTQGDGTRAAMRSLMALAMSKQALFFMEEPECHQHPGSLTRYATAVCGLAKEQEVQLFISTHSAECVKAFLDAAHEKKSEAAVFHLSLTDGKQQARRLNAADVETLQATGIDVRFLDLYA